jgi:hypothetical protein
MRIKIVFDLSITFFRAKKPSFLLSFDIDDSIFLKLYITNYTPFSPLTPNKKWAQGPTYNSQIALHLIADTII